MAFGQIEMGGLGTVATVSAHIALALGLPPIAWVLQPVEQFALAGFDAGVCWSVSGRGDRVITTAITEAGAAVVAELEPNDAMTIAALCACEGT